MGQEKQGQLSKKKTEKMITMENHSFQCRFLFEWSTGIDNATLVSLLVESKVFVLRCAPAGGRWIVMEKSEERCGPEG